MQINNAFSIDQFLALREQARTRLQFQDLQRKADTVKAEPPAEIVQKSRIEQKVPSQPITIEQVNSFLSAKLGSNAVREQILQKKHLGSFLDVIG
jgi:hypothetical protein